MSAALQLVTSPDTTDLQAEGSALVTRAHALVITDDTTYKTAVAFMNDCAGRRRAIVEKFADPKKKAHEAHKSICALESELLTVVDRAEREAKKRIGDYAAEQQRRAEAERRRLEDEARKREEDRRLAEALDAEEAGDEETAMEIISEPIAPPPVHIAPATPKVAGVQFRETWTFECTSLLDVVRHVAAHPEDVNLLQLNTVAVRQMVNARKSLLKVPGIRVYSEKTVAAGGRR